MKSGVFALAIFPLAVFLCVQGSPLEEVKPRQVVIEPYRRFVESLVFAADKPAKVIGIGNGRTYLALYLYDPYGNCVAWDDQGTLSIKDDVYVEFFPHHNEIYSYEIRNQGSSFNRLEIAVR